MKFRRKVYVVGGDLTTFIGKNHPDFIWKKHPDFGKRENPTLEDYLVDAIRGALSKTGVDASAVEKGFVGNFAGELFAADEVDGIFARVIGFAARAVFASAFLLAGVEVGAQGNDFAMTAAPSIPGYEPSTDPRDFSGLWRAKPVPGSFLPFVLGANLPLTDTAKARVDYALEMAAQNTQLATPHIMCRPTGVNQAIGPIAPVYVLQNAEKMVFVVMDEIRDIRQVYFADEHPKNLERSGDFSR